MQIFFKQPMKLLYLKHYYRKSINKVMRTLPLICICVVLQIFSLSGQKRCYTYDNAGNRTVRDLSCDIACTTLVSNTNDAGPGSLRKAVTCAQAGQTVSFAAFMQNEEIVFTSAPILVDKSITISQQSNQVIMRDYIPLFQVTAQGVVFQNLKMKCSCYANVQALAIDNSGGLTLTNVTIESDDTGQCLQNFIKNTGQITITGTTKLIKP